MLSIRGLRGEVMKTTSNYHVASNQNIFAGKTTKYDTGDYVHHFNMLFLYFDANRGSVSRYNTRFWTWPVIFETDPLD